MDKNHIINSQHNNQGVMLSNSGSTIYRMSLRGDRWGCKSCSKTYDKWGMIDHICNKNGRKYTEPPRGATGYSSTAVVEDNKFCITKKEKVMSKDMSEIRELSVEAKEVIQRNIEAREQSNKFVKFQPGEKKVLRFVPEKTELIYAEFNGEKKLRFRYAVIEEGGDQEKFFDVSKRTSGEIDALLLEGCTKQKISRSGLGIDTRYYPLPA